MEVAPLPALNREFTTYRSRLTSAASAASERSAAAGGRRRCSGVGASPAWAVSLAALALLAMLGKAGAETVAADAAQRRYPLDRSRHQSRRQHRCGDRTCRGRAGRLPRRYLDRPDAGGELERFERRQDLHVSPAARRQVSQRRDHDRRRRGLVAEALARPGDAVALPVRVQCHRHRADRNDRSARSADRRRHARSADGACSSRHLARPDCGQTAIIHRDPSGPTASGSPRSAPARSSSASGSGDSMSISSASTATSRAPSRAPATPAPRASRSTACAST